MLVKSVTDRLELPKDMMFGVPILTITGQNDLTVENYKGILEYENFFVRLNTTIGVLNINGFNLSLNEMTDEDLIITGKIESIDFESATDEEE